MEKTKEEIKTLEQCKIMVAKKNGFDDWADLQATWLKRAGKSNVIHEAYADQIAELYSTQQSSLHLQRIKELETELEDLKNELWEQGNRD